MRLLSHREKFHPLPVLIQLSSPNFPIPREKVCLASKLAWLVTRLTTGRCTQVEHEIPNVNTLTASLCVRIDPQDQALPWLSRSRTSVRRRRLWERENLKDVIAAKRFLRFRLEHFMWRQCCHVGGQKQYIFSPLGNKIYFHAKLFHCFSPLPRWPGLCHLILWGLIANYHMYVIIRLREMQWSLYDSNMTVPSPMTSARAMFLSICRRMPHIFPLLKSLSLHLCVSWSKRFSFAANREEEKLHHSWQPVCKFKVKSIYIHARPPCDGKYLKRLFSNVQTRIKCFQKLDFLVWWRFLVFMLSFKL